MTLQIPVMRMPFVLILLSAGLAGCSSWPSMPKLGVPSLTPYKIDIQQGNFVDQEMLAKLQPGMTRAQVKFVMGTPLVTDVFHANRWDYIYIYRKDGKVIEQRRAVLYFDGDKLERVVNLLGEDKSATGKKSEPTPGVTDKKAVPPSSPPQQDGGAVSSPTIAPAPMQ